MPSNNTLGHFYNLLATGSLGVVPDYMRLQDRNQNLSARIWTIHALVIASLLLLAGRLYTVQIIRGQRYAEIAKNQRLRTIPIRAPRGAILDRFGRVLVDSRPGYAIELSREDLQNVNSLVQPLTKGLHLEPEFLHERFAEMSEQPAYESITIKEDATIEDIAWVEAHQLEYPQLRVESIPVRNYPADGLLAHTLGYVGEISSRQLKLPRFKNGGYKAGDIIGKEGLEFVYDKYLRGVDGKRTVIVDALGRIQETLEVVRPEAGQDLLTTIDLDLQREAERQLRISPSQRGVVIAMDPNNDEILALASAPTFDPNLFSQRITTSEGRQEYAELLNDPQTPLYNRAIQGRYPPGSTWKVPMAVAGLQQGVITLEDSRLLCGGGIQIGNKFTRCMGHHGKPDLHTAIMKSCDGYFYRLGLKMGLPGIMKMVDEFELNQRTGIDLPHELVSWTPSPEFKARFNPRSPQWHDIDTVYASFGQVYDFVTPLALLRAYIAIAANGRLLTPHVMKEIRPVGAPGDPDYRPPRKYKQQSTTLIPMSDEDHQAVIDAMWSVVNEAGTAAAIRKVGFDIAGKTGTAQVVGLGKDVGNKKDHSWFVSFAPAFRPQVAMLAMIENSGFGSRYAAPAVRAMYDVYFDQTHDSQIAENQVAPTNSTTELTHSVESKSSALNQAK